MDAGNRAEMELARIEREQDERLEREHGPIMPGYRSCVACSGRLHRLHPLDSLSMSARRKAGDVADDLLICEDCFGIHGPREAVMAAIDVETMVQGEPRGDLRYFDCEGMVDGEYRRTHGWFDSWSRQVAQFG